MGERNGRRRRTGLCLPVALTLLALTLGVWPWPAAAGGDGEDDWIRTTGDILQIALPVLGGGATFFTNPDPDRTWDREGTVMFAKAYGLAWGSTYFLKLALSKARPNGDNRTSFPSGHTMSAFAGAAWIDGRYGKAWGLPAYALATFTGYSRVHSGWHYRDDVLAGASIGLMSNWLITEPLPGKVQLLPTVGADGYGVQVSVGGGGGAPAGDDARPRGASFRLGFGPAFMITNQVQSLGDGGTLLQLGELDGNNDPTTTAAVSIGVPVSSRGRILLTYGPFEARDEGAFSRDVSFGGQTYAAGSEVWTSWRYYDLYALYRHTLLDSPRWGVYGGAGAGIMYSYLAMTTPDGSQSSKVDDTVLYPFLHLTAERRISSRVSLAAWSEGIAISDNWVFNLGGELTWHAARAWDASLGYFWFTRRIDSDTFYNETRYNVPYLGITRYW